MDFKEKFNFGVDRMKQTKIITTGKIIHLSINSLDLKDQFLTIAIIKIINGKKFVKHFTWISECLKHDAQYVFYCLTVYISDLFDLFRKLY
jgi:hypothetical protein